MIYDINRLTFLGILHKCDQSMVIVINKHAKAKEIDAALKSLEKTQKVKKLSSFYGKLKGAYGDALEYQKKIRNEWD
jgi:hypothetical protein